MLTTTNQFYIKLTFPNPNKLEHTTTCIEVGAIHVFQIRFELPLAFLVDSKWWQVKKVIHPSALQERQINKQHLKITTDKI